MKTLPKVLLALTAVAALSIVYPTSVQAVPTMYQYTGNPFTYVNGVYTTSDFVTVMFRLAGPLAPNMPITAITPIAFTLSDGVQTITPSNANSTSFQVATGAAGQITHGLILAEIGPSAGIIETTTAPAIGFLDIGILNLQSQGVNFGPPGTWTTVESVADTGSTLSLMALTVMVFGVAARRFKRGAV